MAERKIVKKKKKKGEPEEQPLTKDETDVAKYLRWNLPNKNSVMYGDKVQYFIGSKAVDFLLDSKWATGTTKSTVQITDRESACDLLDRFLMLGLINRVYRIRKEKRGKEKEKGKGKGKEDKEKTEKSEQKSGDSGGADSPKHSPKPKKKEKDSGKEKEDSKENKKKKKVKVSLEPHNEPVFLDDDEAYVWIYDPVHPKTFVLGVLVVLGVVAVCLFPLWPDSMREYSWYLSVLAAIFVGFIFLLAILRYVVFAALWVLTMGKLHFWFLPNLTEDCGFFESFVPAYEYEYHGKAEKKVTEEEQKGEEEKVKNEDDTVEPPLDTNIPTNEEAAEDAPLKTSEKESGESSGSNRDTDENETEAWVKVQKADIDENKTETELKC